MTVEQSFASAISAARRLWPGLTDRGGPYLLVAHVGSAGGGEWHCSIVAAPDDGGLRGIVRLQGVGLSLDDAASDLASRAGLAREGGRFFVDDATAPNTIAGACGKSSEAQKRARRR